MFHSSFKHRRHFSLLSFTLRLAVYQPSLKRKDSTLYFLTGFVAYVIGLLTTFIVMHAFKAAQVSRSLSSNHPVHKLKIYYDLFCNYE